MPEDSKPEPMEPEEKRLLEKHVRGSLDRARVVANSHPSRPLSLVITKLEEAEMWLERVDSRPVMREPQSI